MQILRKDCYKYLCDGMRPGCYWIWSSHNLAAFYGFCVLPHFRMKLQFNFQFNVTAATPRCCCWPFCLAKRKCRRLLAPITVTDLATSIVLLAPSDFKSYNLLWMPLFQLPPPPPRFYCDCYESQQLQFQVYWSIASRPPNTAVTGDAVAVAWNSVSNAIDNTLNLNYSAGTDDFTSWSFWKRIEEKMKFYSRTVN